MAGLATPSRPDWVRSFKQEFYHEDWTVHLCSLHPCKPIQGFQRALTSENILDNVVIILVSKSTRKK